jgi:hypothetical protein
MDIMMGYFPLEGRKKERKMKLNVSCTSVEEEGGLKSYESKTNNC